MGERRKRTNEPGVLILPMAVCFKGTWIFGVVVVPRDWLGEAEKLVEIVKRIIKK